MSILARLRDDVILKRTGLTAQYNGKVIHGCSECGDNHEFPGVLPYAPIHRCIAEIDSTGQNPIILDPFNIPNWCPRQLQEVFLK
jgi:hypothetical protein